MAEWTPEAKHRLAEYLGEISDLARKAGDDVPEITESLKEHVVAETESIAGVVVTLNHLERTLGTMGSPAQVIGVELTAMAGDAGENSVSSTARETRKQQRQARMARPRARTAIVMVLGVFIPLIALGVEFCHGFMAQIFLNPIPTWSHLFLLAALALSFIPVDWYIRRAIKQKEVKRTGLILFLNGFALAMSLVVSLAYIPVLPISVIATIFFFAGLLGFAPFFCFGCAIFHFFLLRKLTTGPETSKRRRFGPTMVGFLLSILGMGYLEFSPLLGRHFLQLAVSLDKAEREQGIWWLKVLGREDQVLQACYGPVGRGGRYLRDWNLLGSNAARSNVSHVDYQTLYFRLTGKPYNSVPRPTRPGSLHIPRGFRDWQEFGIEDSQVGGTEVAGRIKGLTLASSVIDVNFSGAVDQTGGPATAYMEWIMEFQNKSSMNQEARGLITTPHGAVGSRLTLWIDGQEREAAFGGRSQVRKAYREVAVVRRRDPALLNTAGPDRLFLQCFPILPGKIMKVKVGLTIPLVIRNEEAFLRLPYFCERNFSIPADLKHHLWAKSAKEFYFKAVPDGASVMAKEKSGRVFHEQVPESLLQDPGAGLFILPAPQLTRAAAYAGALGSVRASMTMTPLAPHPGKRKSLCLVVDGSSAMNRVSIDWQELLDNLPEDVMVTAVHGGQKVSEWQQDFKRPGKALVSWLKGLEYQGGCDPVPALIRAWELTASRSGGTILWLHGPLPVELSSIETLRQWIRRSPTGIDNQRLELLSVALLPGPNRVVEKLGSLAGFTRVPVIGSLARTLQYTAANLRADDSNRAFSILSTGYKAGGESMGIQPTPGVARLAINDFVLRAFRNGKAKNIDKARDMAIKARLITPLSGAVVLEQEEQYKRHGLDPNRNPEAVAGIPEPEEWALMLVLAGILLYVFWSGRRTIALDH